MTNFDYTRDIPASNNDPSQDQPDMLVNTNSTDSLIAEDHFSFGVPNGGRHEQCTIGNRFRIPISPAIPDGVNQFGTLYCDDTISSGSDPLENGLWYMQQKDKDSLYQLTRTVASKNTLFGKLTQDFLNPSTGIGVGNAFSAGWTFLPGGLLMQYGVATVTSSTPIIFPVLFTDIPFSIQVTGAYSNLATGRFLYVSSQSNSAFAIQTLKANETGSSATRITWIAIGL